MNADNTDLLFCICTANHQSIVFSRRISSGRLWNEQVDEGIGGSDERRDKLCALGGEMVAMCVWNLPNEMVGAEQPKFSADGAGATPSFLIGSGRRGVKQPGEVLVAQAIDEKLAPSDGFQQEAIRRGQRMQCPRALAVPDSGLFDGIDQLLQSGAVIYTGQCVQISVIGALRHFRPAMQIGDSFAHAQPSQRSIGISFGTAIDFKVLRLVHCEFGA